MTCMNAEVFFIEIFLVKILFLCARFCMCAPSLICDFIILFSFADPTIRSCTLFSGSLKLRACSVAVVSMLFVVARTVRDFCGSFDVYRVILAEQLQIFRKLTVLWRFCGISRSASTYNRDLRALWRMFLRKFRGFGLNFGANL